MKRFFKLLAIVILSEFIILMLATFLSQQTTGILHRIGYLITAAFSLPISLIDNEYPFYTESGIVTLITCVINILIHTAIVFIILKANQKRKQEKMR